MADFSFEGLLGGINNAFGGGSSNYLDEYLTPDQKRMMQRNAMLAASAALLKAGGESTRRIGIGEALGEALQAGQGGYEKAQTGALTQMALKTKMDEAKRAAELRKRIAGVFSPQAATPGAAPMPMPEVDTGVPPLPTSAGAAMPPAQGMPAPMNQNVAMANQYRQVAKMLAENGQIEQAMKSVDMALKLDPPVTLSDKAKLLSELGLPPTVANLRLLEKPEGLSNQTKLLGELGLPPTLANLRLLDKPESLISKVGPGEFTTKSIDKFNVTQKYSDLVPIPKVAADKAPRTQQVQLEDGTIGLINMDTGAIIKSTVGGVEAKGKSAEGKPTEDQSKSAGFAYRMKQSTDIFNQPILDASGNQIIDKDTNKPITLEQAYGKPGRYQAIMRAMPTAGLTTGIANMSESAGRQQYRQAQENWVTANLRPESGAVIGEGEMEKEITKYFPQVNDDAKTIDQKARARRDTELAMTVRAGPAYKQLQQQIPRQRQPRLVRDPQTGVIRYVED